MPAFRRITTAVVACPLLLGVPAGAESPTVRCDVAGLVADPSVLLVTGQASYAPSSLTSITCTLYRDSAVVYSGTRICPGASCTLTDVAVTPAPDTMCATGTFVTPPAAITVTNCWSRYIGQ